MPSANHAAPSNGIISNPRKHFENKKNHTKWQIYLYISNKMRIFAQFL